MDPRRRLIQAQSWNERFHAIARQITCRTQAVAGDHSQALPKTEPPLSRQNIGITAHRQRLSDFEQGPQNIWHPASMAHVATASHPFWVRKSGCPDVPPVVGFAGLTGSFGIFP